MSKNWDYAALSKAASKAGGPEQYIKLIEKVSRESGHKDMAPVIMGTAVISSVCTYFGVKWTEHRKKKSAEQEKELRHAKQEIIHGIKTYDESCNLQEREREEDKHLLGD